MICIGGIFLKLLVTFVTSRKVTWLIVDCDLIWKTDDLSVEKAFATKPHYRFVKGKWKEEKGRRSDWCEQSLRVSAEW